MTFIHQSAYMKVKVKWHVAKYGYPYSDMCSAFNPSKVHTHSSEHTHTPPEQLGVRCLAQGHLSRGIEGGREHCTFPPPTHNSCQTWDSNSQPLGYKSDSLTIRPRLPTERPYIIRPRLPTDWLIKLVHKSHFLQIEHHGSCYVSTC